MLPEQSMTYTNRLPTSTMPKKGVEPRDPWRPLPGLPFAPRPLASPLDDGGLSLRPNRPGRSPGPMIGGAVARFGAAGRLFCDRATGSAGSSSVFSAREGVEATGLGEALGLAVGTSFVSPEGTFAWPLPAPSPSVPSPE